MFHHLKSRHAALSRGHPVAKPTTASSSSSDTSGSTSTTQSTSKLLAELKNRSQAAILKHSSQQTEGTPARLIDERMYHSALEMRMRTNEKLSEMNKYANHLKSRLSETEQDLSVAYQLLSKIEGEFLATERQTESLLATCKFSPNTEEVPTMILRLSDRLASLQEATRKAKEAFRARVPQKIPLTWNGVAQSVRFVGEFDSWTLGVDLNASDLDSSVRSFEGSVSLLPGRYRCKFVVDGEWRIAPEGWEISQDEDGNLNNILTVE